jgi:predicted transcriptional regulator
MSNTTITDAPTAAVAIRHSRLMLRDGVYRVGGRDAVVEQRVFEGMLRDGLIQRVGRGIYELTNKGRELARSEAKR